MRREERAIKSPVEIERIIHEAEVLRVAFSRNDRPYLVPMCFGYAEDVFYCHSAPEGTKIDMLRANPNVCFECEAESEVVPGDPACRWAMKYRSVIGFGRATLVDDDDEKMRALQTIMEHYSGERPDIPQEGLRRTAIIRIDVESMTGKAAG